LYIIFYIAFNCGLPGYIECLTPYSLSCCCFHSEWCKVSGYHLNFTCFLSFDWYIATLPLNLWILMLSRFCVILFWNKCRSILKHGHMLGLGGTVNAADECKVQFITFKSAVWNWNRNLSLHFITTKLITIYFYKEVEGEW
jgi:hypothetical protein